MCRSFRSNPIKASKLHLAAWLFLLLANCFAIGNASFFWPLKIILLLAVFFFCGKMLIYEILEPRELPSEFQLLYAKIWRYALVVIVRDKISGKKQSYFFSRDQFNLMQWKILRRKLRFYR